MQHERRNQGSDQYVRRACRLRRERVRELASVSSPRRAAELLADGDPFALLARTRVQLKSRALMFDPVRIYRRAIALLAFDLAGSAETQRLGRLFDQALTRALEAVAAEDRAAQLRPRDVASKRRVLDWSVRFNALPHEARQAYYQVCVRRRPLLEYAVAIEQSAQQVREWIDRARDCFRSELPHHP